MGRQTLRVAARCPTCNGAERGVHQIGVDLAGSSPDFSKSKRPPDAMIDRWAETAALAVNNAAPLIDPSHGVFPGHSSGESAQ